MDRTRAGCELHEHGTEESGRRGHRRRIGAVLALSAAYMLVEIIGGLWTGSLALLADAGHMASDVAALGFTLVALWMADRPPSTRRTYGHARVEILAALAHGVALVAVALLIVFEAAERLGSSRDIEGLGMLVVATGGLVINGVGLGILHSGRQHNLNVRGAWLHVLSDALGSVGAIAAGLCVWLLGWNWADAVVSLAISVLILISAWQLLREAVDVLMETVPPHLDVDEIRAALSDLPSVVGVHDLHVWTIGSGEVSFSSHVVAGPGAAATEVLEAVDDLLDRRFGIHHTTVQIETEAYAAEELAPLGQPAGGSSRFGHHE